ncbi:RIP metalloprotease RseP [Enterovirga aerilata]|uniref:Zinc metalloprotease n=1 Tax=Enterovirga aerilata TaxID=2730920 RepID=A0A849I489_9HYPH|nr:RIP metalloprotease RseP [Enterovirga sp. DB1703]NNM72494.1 RIP metalloprotease RseP [Enterovirga sp. DB1703]
MEFVAAALGKTGAFLVYPVAFLFVLTIVVFVHEYGHFWVGRRCGVGVKAFSIGFGRELFGWDDRHGTRWKISAIPLGGYVKFVGDMNGASVPDDAALARMPPAERAISFHTQSLPKRAAIVAAGPAANFLLAILVFAGMAYFAGRQVLAPRIETVQPGSAAELAGFRPDDLVISINGRAISSFADMQRLVSTSAGDALEIVVEREGRRLTLQATPTVREVEVPGFGKQKMGLLGVQGSKDPADLRFVRYGPLESLAIGAQETWSVVDRTFNYLGKLVSGRESAQQLSGPIGIMRVSGEVASMGGVGPLISLVAILSVSIGLINLFPIPLLDGGHLLFYAVEAVRGRPLSDRAQEIGFRIGLAIVVMLMLFATWNDIVHLGASFAGRGT